MFFFNEHINILLGQFTKRNKDREQVRFVYSLIVNFFLLGQQVRTFVYL